MSEPGFQAGLHAALGVSFAWLAVGAVCVQTWRGGGALAPMSVSDETAAAARESLRRSTLLACAFTAAILLAWTCTGGLLQSTLLRALMFAAIPVVTFIGARPLLRRGVNPAARTDDPPSRRTASLVARDDIAIGAVWWTLPTATLAGGIAVVGAAWPGGDAGMLAVLSLCGAASFFAAFGWWAVTPRTFRHDLSGARDPEALDAAYRAFGRFLSRSVFALMVACVSLFSGVAAVAALGGIESDAGRWLGWIGGGGGALIGLGGGVFGTLADRHRRAILELGGLPPDASRRRPESGERPLAGERS